MRKLFVMSLTFIMLVLNISVYAEQDIEWNSTPSAWAEHDVQNASELGILPKNIAGYIYPVDRENFCNILYSLLCVDNVIDEEYDAKTPFSDIDSYKISTLYDLGIIAGYDEKKFEPLKRITREEVAVILDRSMRLCDINISENNFHKTFADDDTISEWAKKPVENIKIMELMNGDELNCFNPQENITLEESIVTIMRLHKLIIN